MPARTGHSRRGAVALDSGPCRTSAWGGLVNRAQLRQLADDRIVDAKLLLDNARPSGAYYLAGYAVECGLKACIMHHVEATGAIFQDRKFSEKCWTHDLNQLLAFANLESELAVDAAANAALSANWAVATDWRETSRYERKTPAEATTMYNAIADKPDGVLAWLQKHW